MTRATPATRPVQVPDHPRSPTGRQRIAVGTDGTSWGDAALDWALRHAALRNAYLHVFAAETSDGQVIARRLNAYRWLDASVTASPSPPVHTLIAASTESDLVVLGYRGRHHGPFGLGRSIVPIITAAHCDTVVIRGESRAVHGEHGWITAAVGGQDDDLVVRRAVQVASRSRSKLRLVHAVPPPAARQVPTMVDPSDVLEHARILVRELAPGLTPSLHLVHCQPHEAVRTCARSDLLVIGPGSRTGQLSMITSTALHMATCPVLVVKPA